MNTARDHLIDWLRDAYAMEIQAEKMMQNMHGRLRQYPALATRLEQHIAETKSQAEQVKQCLHQLGADTSALKTGLAALTGFAQAMSGAIADDEVVKGGVFSHAFEQFEVANYTVLVAAATAAGEPGIAATMDAIRREEEAMAGWLRDNLEAIVQQYLLTGEKR